MQSIQQKLPCILLVSIKSYSPYSLLELNIVVAYTDFATVIYVHTYLLQVRTYVHCSYVIEIYDTVYKWFLAVNLTNFR